ERASRLAGLAIGANCGIDARDFYAGPATDFTDAGFAQGQPGVMEPASAPGAISMIGEVEPYLAQAAADGAPGGHCDSANDGDEDGGEHGDQGDNESEGTGPGIVFSFTWRAGTAAPGFIRRAGTAAPYLGCSRARAVGRERAPGTYEH